MCGWPSLTVGLLSQRNVRNDGDSMKLRRRPVKTAASVEANCPSCGHNSKGRFCSACGEDKGRSKDYSLLGHLGETFKVITSIESGFLRSFAALITKPGLLTSEYFAGRRQPFLKPLQLFLFCNIAFFLVQSFTGFNTLSTPLSIHMSQLPYSSYARQKVNRTVIERRTTLNEYRVRFDATIATQAKTLVFLMIPMFALLLQLLYWRAGRYFVEHLVFATHFYSFFLLLLSAALLVTSTAVSVARRFTNNLAIFDSDLLFTLILMALCLTYLLFAMRRFYNQHWLLTVLKGVVLIGGVMFIVQLYRFCLFFTAAYWV
jgi:hypothetical protein